MHLLFDILLGTPVSSLTYSAVGSIRNQIQDRESRSAQFFQTQICDDGHPTAGLNALRIWLDSHTGSLSYGTPSALGTKYRPYGYLLAVVEDATAKQRSIRRQTTHCRPC